MKFSKINGETKISLIDHTKMVINLAVETARKNLKETNNDLLSKIAIAAALHDIGKCSKDFQEYIINKNSGINAEGIEIYPLKKNCRFYRHNSISWAFASSFVGSLSTTKYRPIRSAILYHHTVIDDFSLKSSDIIGDLLVSDNECIESMKSIYNECLSYIDEKFGFGVSTNKDFCLNNVSDIDEVTPIKIETELVYNEPDNSLNNFLLNPLKNSSYQGSLQKYQDKSWEFAIIRALIVYADRAISSMVFDNERILNLDCDYIKSIFTNHLISSYNKKCDLGHYDESRLQEQRGIVNKIKDSKHNICDVGASAGFGKTLVGLLYHFEIGRKVMWVVPRTIIAEGTYCSIVSELETMGMNDEVKVCLMYGNDIQKCNFNDGPNIPLNSVSKCDIVVSVIDTFLSRYSRNELSTFLLDCYFSDIIFDEYHEFFCGEPIFGAFINMLYARNKYTNAKTLLLSASGFNGIIEKFCGKTEYIPSKVYGGDTKVHINVQRIQTPESLEIKNDCNCFAIAPTVDLAQNLFTAHKKNGCDFILEHARFSIEDRDNNESLIYKLYGKHSTFESKDKKTVIGTPIIGTGLDISSMSIIHYTPTPESTVQICCGRSSRFNEYDEVNYTVVLYSNRKYNRFLNRIYNNELRSKWCDRLASMDGTKITKSELYNERNEFNKKNEKQLLLFISKLYKTSIEELYNIRYKGGSSFVNEDYECLSKEVSYRGSSNNIYVTAKIGGEYMKPIVCDSYILDEESNGIESKERYNFMISNNTGFNFPTDKELKYVYGIKKWGDATIEKCVGLANRSDRPFLLQGYSYSKELGLYKI